MFLVLKYGCESWTLNKTLIKRIDAFKQSCYKRILKVSWKDRVSNEQVLHRMGEEKLHFRKNIVKQKLAYVGHVLKGSSGLNALLVLGEKFDGKRTRGRPRTVSSNSLWS